MSNRRKNKHRADCRAIEAQIAERTQALSAAAAERNEQRYAIQPRFNRWMNEYSYWLPTRAKTAKKPRTARRSASPCVNK